MLALSADILNGSDTVSLSILQNILLPKKMSTDLLQSNLFTNPHMNTWNSEVIWLSTDLPLRGYQDDCR